MKKVIAWLITLILLISISGTALATTAGKPTFTGYSDESITSYDLSDGTLKIYWSATGASKYYVKAILLNEEPNSWDSSQSDRAVAVLKDGEQTAKYVSLTKTKLSTGNAQYLKVAVGAFASGETKDVANWNWIGFKLTKEKVVASSPVFKNGSASSIVEYDIADGALTVSWSAKNADSYRVKAILMNSAPNFGSSSDTAVDVLYDDDWSKTTLPFSVSDLRRAPYLKVAVGAMSEDETLSEAHWSVIGFKLVESDGDPFPSSTYKLTGNANADLVGIARTQIGYKGSSNKNNITGANVTSVGDYTKYGVYTGTNGQDWCASFVSWCGHEAGISTIKNAALAGPFSLCSNAYNKGAVVYFNELNSSQSSKADLEKYGTKATRGSVTPAVGDLIFFRWSTTAAQYAFSHVGIVSKISGSTVYYIDGNGSGDVVKERSMKLTSTDIAAFCKLSGTYNVSPDEPVAASVPVFTNGSASTIVDHNISSGALTVSWTAQNADHYKVKAILMNTAPDFSSSGDTAVEVLYDDSSWTSTSLPFSVSDLKKASYLKVAVGAMSKDETENQAHWATIGFKLNNSSKYALLGGTIDYAPGDYFTVDGTASGESIRVEGAIECWGFANYVEKTIYGSLGQKYSDWTVKVEKGKLTVDVLKSLITTAGLGAHIRTNVPAGATYGHSFIVTAISDSGFSIIQCNGHNNKEYSLYAKNRIGTYTYTWESYVNDEYGSRGIDWIRTHNGNRPTKNASPTSTPIPATPTPTAKPTATPTVAPTATPTAKPTAAPTANPTAAPTPTPTPKPAVGNAQLTASASAMQADGTFTVTLGLKRNSVLGGMRLSYSFSGNQATINQQDCHATGIATGASVSAGDKISLASTNPISSDGDVLVLSFTALDPKKDITVNFSCEKATDPNQERVLIDGISVSVAAANARVPGDANEDGEPDFVDAMLILQYDARWPGLRLNLSNADVNRDGDVDFVDAMLILQYDARWPGTVLR